MSDDAAPAANVGTSQRTLRAAFRSQVVALSITYSFSFLIVPFILDRLGPTLFGVWSAIASIVAIGALADAGVRTEISRRVAAAVDEDPGGASTARIVSEGTSLLAAMAAALVLGGLLAAPLVVHFAFPRPPAGYDHGELVLLLRATVLLLGCGLVMDGYYTVLNGLQRPDIETYAGLVGVVVVGATAIIGLAAGWGLWALFAGQAAQQAFVAAVKWIGLRRILPGLRARFIPVGPGLLRSYFVLSGLALVMQVADVIDAQWDKLVLSRYVGGSAVTAFQVGTSLVLQVRALALIPLAPLLAALAELRERDPRRAAALYERLAVTALAIGAVAFSGLFAFAPPFVELWLGAGYGAAATSTRLFAIAMSLNLIGAPMTFRCLAEGRHREAALSAVMNIIVNGGVSYGLAVTIGTQGPVLGSIAGNAVGLVAMMILRRKESEFGWMKRAAAPVAAGVLAAAAADVFGLDPRSALALVGEAVLYGVVVGSVCVWLSRIPLRDFWGDVFRPPLASRDEQPS